MASWLYSCIGAASLLARIPGSKLCDVFGPQRVFLVSSAAGAVEAILLPLATNWTGLLCLSIVYGISDGLMAIGAILSVLCTLTPTQKAQGFGFFQLCICMTALCGPPIGGKVKDVGLSRDSSQSVAISVAHVDATMAVLTLETENLSETDDNNSLETNYPSKADVIRPSFYDVFLRLLLSFLFRLNRYINQFIFLTVFHLIFKQFEFR